MIKGSWIVLVLLPILLFPPSMALGEEFVDPHWEESPINFTAGMKFGAGFFIAGEVMDVYGEKGVPFYSFEAGWKIVHELELQGEIGYWWDQGRGVASDGKQTNEKYKLHMAPAELGFAYRFNFVYDQIVVPYIGASGIYSYFLEERLDSSWKKRGAIWGAAGKAGLMILLDNAEKHASSKLEGDWGINSTYLIYNFKYNYLNDFNEDKGLDLSSHVHTLGFLFEF